MEEPRRHKNVMLGFYVDENIHKGDTRFMPEWYKAVKNKMSIWFLHTKNSFTNWIESIKYQKSSFAQQQVANG